jgi:pimeloyl-ACP methyl ester carboxylesterase
MTALGVAVRAPERLRSLVALGIATAREPRASVAGRLMDPARILRDDPAWAADLARLHDPVQGTGAWQRLLPAVADDVARQPLLGPADLRRISPPTLVACGDRDPLVPVAQAAALARHVRDGRLLVVPGGHDILSQQPALVTEAMTGFHGAIERGAEPSAASPSEGRP